MITPNNTKIIIGKYDNSIILDTSSKKKVVYFPRLSKKNKRVEFKPIATNGKVVYDGSNAYQLNDFFIKSEMDPSLHLIVLTNKEHSLILREAISNKIDISILESDFPIFKAIKYTESVKINYEVLKKKLMALKSFGIDSKTLSNNFSNELIKKIKRKIRHKTNIDKCFHFSYLPPFQEVFKFSEEREDRCVIALDYNSMFSSCFEGKFLDPKSIFFSKIERTYKNETLEEGLYRVIFKTPRESYFRNYHPFKYTRSNKSFSFTLNHNHDVEVMVFRSELEYYSKFFEDTYIVSGLLSKALIGHPLYGTAKKLYKKRLEARSRGSEGLERLYKYKLAMLHSSTNPIRIKTIAFKRKRELYEHLNNKYGVSHVDEDGKLDLSDLYHPKYFNFSFLESGIELRSIDIDSNDCIYSLSSQVLACARLKISRLIEKLMLFSCLEVCYINTDSVHISIPKIEKPKFLSFLGSLVNNDLGGLKVQAVGDKAFWFDVGRYFIFDNEKVVQFKNSMLNHNGNSRPFLDRKKILRIFSGEIFRHVVESHITLVSSLTYKKRLNHNLQSSGTVDFERFSFEEIKTFRASYNTVTDEMLSSRLYKETVFKNLKSSYGGIC